MTNCFATTFSKLVGNVIFWLIQGESLGLLVWNGRYKVCVAWHQVIEYTLTRLNEVVRDAVMISLESTLSGHPIVLSEKKEGKK